MMNWRSVYRSLLAALLFGQGGLAIANTAVIVKSDVAEWPTGRVLRDADALSFAKGQITLMTEAGRLIALSGPFKGGWQAGRDAVKSEADAKAALRQAVERMIVDQSGGSRVLGAIREAKADEGELLVQSGSSQSVTVDAGRDGQYCVTPSASLNVQRSNSALEAMQIRAVPGQYAQWNWSLGQMEQPWPRNVLNPDPGLPAEGVKQKFLLKRGDSLLPKVLTLIGTPPDFEQYDLHYRASYLAAMGCFSQASGLLTQIKSATNASGKN